MELRQMLPTDSLQVSHLLVDTLKGSLLQKLGKKFTQQFFLSQAFSQQGLRQYVCIVENKIVGYLLFADEQSRMQHFGKTLAPVILMFTLLKCWAYPSLLVDLAASFFNKSSLLDDKKSSILNQATYLVYFAIDAQFQSQGLGSQALTQCLQDLSPSACLVETHNPRAVKFYEKNQFKLIGYRKRIFSSFSLLLMESSV